MIRISIVTPTFNSAATLRDTLDSVLAQSFRNYEYLVVDGGSKDSTVELLREYEPRFDGRMRWISERDRGLYDALNKGYSMSNGDVVGLLNSDDFFTSDDILQTIADAFDGHPEKDAVYADIHFVKPDNLSTPVRYYSSAKFTPEKMRMGYMPAHPSFYARRACFEKYGMFDLDFKVAADFENLLRLIYVNRINACYIPKDFVTMRTGGMSTSGLKSYRQIIRDHFRAFEKNGLKVNYLSYFSRYPRKLLEFIVK